MTHHTLMLFDGKCGFCSRSVLFILKRTGPDLKFCAMQSDYGQVCLESLGWPRDDYQTMAIMNGGETLIKSEAVLALTKHMGAGWQFAATIIGHIPLPARDALYDFIARNRYSIAGKRRSCLMPTKSTQDRFVVQAAHELIF